MSILILKWTKINTDFNNKYKNFVLLNPVNLVNPCQKKVFTQAERGHRGIRKKFLFFGKKEKFEY